jgi:hypothetical protein
LHVADEEQNEVKKGRNVHAEDAPAYGHCQLSLEFGLVSGLSHPGELQRNYKYQLTSIWESTNFFAYKTPKRLR